MKRKLSKDTYVFYRDQLSIEVAGLLFESQDSIKNEDDFKKCLETVLVFGNKTYVATVHCYVGDVRDRWIDALMLVRMWEAVLARDYNEAAHELCRFMSLINVLEIRFFLIIEYIYSYMEGNTDMAWHILCNLGFKHRRTIESPRPLKSTAEGYLITEEDMKCRYELAMDGVKRTLADASSTDLKDTLLDYYIYVITADLITACRCFYMCRDDDRPVWNTQEYFPLSFTAEGTERTIVTKDHQEIDLKTVPVITSNWNRRRTASSIIRLSKEPFIEDKSNHRVVLYKGLGFAVAQSGNHSINAGSYYKKGILGARIYDVSSAFQFVDTDGANWINAQSREVIIPVFDYRVAILYELQRLKTALQKTDCCA